VRAGPERLLLVEGSLQLLSEDEPVPEVVSDLASDEQA
jgi:hypothetical protein